MEQKEILNKLDTQLDGFESYVRELEQAGAGTKLVYLLNVHIGVIRKVLYKYEEKLKS